MIEYPRFATSNEIMNLSDNHHYCLVEIYITIYESFLPKYRTRIESSTNNPSPGRSPFFSLSVLCKFLAALG